MKYVYIAGPYSGNPEANVKSAIMYADAVREMGLIPFVPHLYHYWDKEHPHDYQYWTVLGLEWVKRCDALLRLPGFSPGSDREVELAKELGKPILKNFCDLREYANACVEGP